MRFVLIHGAWHYGSLWGPVATALIDAGHEVHTPTAGGLGWGNIDRAIGHEEC